MHRSHFCVPAALSPRDAAAVINDDDADGKTKPSAPLPQEHTAKANVNIKPVALLALVVAVAVAAVVAIMLPPAVPRLCVTACFVVAGVGVLRGLSLLYLASVNAISPQVPINADFNSSAVDPFCRVGWLVRLAGKDSLLASPQLLPAGCSPPSKTAVAAAL